MVFVDINGCIVNRLKSFSWAQKKMKGMEELCTPRGGCAEYQICAQ